MKWILLALLPVSVLLAAGCQDKKARPAEGPPALAIEQPHIDLGEVRSAMPGFDGGVAEVRVVFKATNTSDKTVAIKNIITGCGCTKAEDAPESIAPGEQADIPFVYLATQKPGQHTTSVRFIAEEDGLREYTLEFSADVTPVLYWENAIENMGEITVGEEKTVRYALYSLLQNDVQIDSIWTYDERISARPTGESEPFTNKDGELGTKYWIEVTAPPTLSVGQFTTEVILVSDDKEKGFPPLTVRGEVISDITFEPSRVYANIPPGGTKQIAILLRSKSGDPFEILQANLTERLPVEIENHAGETAGEHELLFTFTPREETGGFMAKAVVDIKIENAEKPVRLEIPVMMIVRKDD